MSNLLNTPTSIAPISETDKLPPLPELQVSHQDFDISQGEKYVKTGGEKSSYQFNELWRELKSQIHPDIIMVYNDIIGSGAHGVFFKTPEELVFVSEIGRAGSKEIPYESEFEQGMAGNFVENRQTTTGYKLAMSRLKAFMMERHIHPRFQGKK